MVPRVVRKLIAAKKFAFPNEGGLVPLKIGSDLVVTEVKVKREFLFSLN